MTTNGRDLNGRHTGNDHGGNGHAPSTVVLEPPRTIPVEPAHYAMLKEKIGILKQERSAVILAHNHPSGVAEPSAADRSLTRQLQDDLALVEVRVLDHLVVGEAEVISFCDKGWI